MEKKIDIRPKDLQILLQILAEHLPNTLIWAFGSRVKFTAKPYSDLDLVVFPVENQDLALAREVLEESDLPFRVDLHNWYQLPPKFHKNIQNNYVVIQSSG